MFTLIDGDIIVYSCGFAAQKNLYTVDGIKSFTKKAEANLFADSNHIPRDLITKEITPDPVEFALANVKQTLVSIAEACDSHDGNIYLTGKGNFREASAVTHKYKGNRDEAHKPIHYKAIKEYLISYWDAEVIDGMEADDAMGIYQCSNEGTIICTIDKDLDMIPGWHFNWRKGTKYEVSPFDADRFFQIQMLTGDRTDNIFAIDKVGPKTAEKLLKGKDIAEGVEVIKAQYKKAFKDNWEARYNENEDLLWILRS